MPTTLRADGLYCAYLRKSRRDLELEAQGGEDTLARHERQLNELAARLGITIAQTYREIVSGDTISERPEVRRLLDAVNSGAWDGVLVVDVDRLGRGDSIDQGVIMQSFAYSNTLIVTPEKVYDPQVDADEESVEFRLFFARYEYRAIKKRLQRGRLASAMDGCYMGSRPVYGYERVKLQGRKGWSLKIVPEKAKIVRAVFEWYAYGMDGEEAGANRIALRLNDMGLRTDLGKPFEPSYVRHMLQNPVYIGKVQWNQRVTTCRIEDGKRVKSREKNPNAALVDGLHEPIIEMDLWERVQKMFASHEKRPKNVDKEIANPFAGILFCGECGHSMIRVADDRRKDASFKCRTQRCPTCSAYVGVVEEAVLDVLRGWVTDFEAEGDPAPAPSEAEAEAAEVALASLREQREILTGQLNKLCDLLEQGVYTVEFYQQRHALLTGQLADIDERISRQLAIPRPDPRAKLIPRIRTFLDAYAQATAPSEKNQLLRTIISRIDYHKTQRNYRNNALSDNLTLDIYPKLPED